MEQTGKFSNGRAALGLLALVILAAAQPGEELLASLAPMGGAPVWLGNVLAGVLYAALGVAGLLLLCGKGLRVTPEECRLAPVRLRPVWAASAVLMPALAAGALLCQPGHWQAGSAEDAAAVAAGGALTIAAFAGAKGLGWFINLGLNSLNYQLILLGAIPVSALALLVDFIFGRLERAITSEGLLAPEQIKNKSEREKKREKAAAFLLCGMIILVSALYYTAA